MKIDLNSLDVSVTSDDIASLIDPAVVTLNLGVEFGSKNMDDITVGKAILGRKGTIAASNRGKLSLRATGGEQLIENGLLQHLNLRFNRKAFTEPNRLLLEEALSSRFESESNVFSHRTRPQIDKVYMLKSDSEGFVALTNLTVDSPVCLRYLANKSNRESLMTFISDDDMLTDLVKLIIGTAGRARKGTKRFTMQRLLNWLTRKGGTHGISVTGFVVAAVIIRTILEQFDWEFASLETVRLEEITTRLLNVDDLEDIYVEGWLAKKMPSTSEWVVKYEGHDEITSSAVFETLSSSLVALKHSFMALNLLHKRYSDVVNAARTACAIRHGLVEDIANETLLAFTESSASVQDMAGWSCIVLEMFANKFKNISTGVTATKVGDISLLRDFADGLMDAVRSHPLVYSLTPSDYLRHMEVRHYMTDNNLRYHTTVVGHHDIAAASTHFIEANLGSGIYGVSIIKDNKSFNDEVANFYNRTSQAAAVMLSDLDSIESLYHLSTFERPEDVVNSGCHGFTAINSFTQDLVLLALIQNEVLVKYTRSTNGTAGVSFLNVLGTFFVLHNVATSAANPFPIFDDAVYTESPVLAICMGVEKAGTGLAPLLEVDLKMDSASYLTSDLGSMITLNSIVDIPDSIKYQFTIEDLSKRVINIPVNVDLRHYIALSSFDTTMGVIPRTLEIQRILADYALDVASVSVNFTHQTTQYAYDKERIFATYLLEYMQAALASKHIRSVMSSMRFDAAVAASGQFGSLSNAVHNVALNSHCVLFSAGVPAMVTFNDGAANKVTVLTAAYQNNRLFRDFLMNYIVKGY